MRKRRPFGVVLLVTAVGFAGAAAPATAYFRDYTVVSGSTPNNSIVQKAGLLSVGDCPGPFFGGGAFVTLALPNLGLTLAKQFGGYQYGAGETDPESAAWKVNGRGFCGRNTATPPPLGAAGPYFKGLEIVAKTTGNNSNPIKTAIARCPAGKSAITGGAEILDASSNVAFWSLTRGQAGTAWRAVAHEVDFTNANWSVTAHAVCANITTETATSDYVNDYSAQFNPSTATNSLSPKSLTRTCPAGMTVMGGGAGVLGDAPDVVVTRSSAGSPGSSNTWTAVARETDPTNDVWALNASISCVKVNGGPPA